MRHHNHKTIRHSLNCGIILSPEDLPDELWCDHGVDLLVNECQKCNEEDAELVVSVPYSGTA